MKLTTEKLKELIKEELSRLFLEGLTLKQRERARTMKYNGVEFKVAPLTEDELYDADPKRGDISQNFFGVYQIDYQPDMNREHLYNAILGFSKKKKYSPLFNHNEFESYGIDADPKSPFMKPINFVALLYNRDDSKNEAAFNAIKKFLVL